MIDTNVCLAVQCSRLSCSSVLPRACWSGRQFVSTSPVDVFALTLASRLGLALELLACCIHTPPHGPSLTDMLDPSVSDAAAAKAFDVWLRRPSFAPFSYLSVLLLAYGSLQSREDHCFPSPLFSSTCLISTNTNDGRRLSAYADVALDLFVINRNSCSPNSVPLRWSIAPRITPSALPSTHLALSLSPRLSEHAISCTPLAYTTASPHHDPRQPVCPRPRAGSS
jgi:hypothetical protein